jgi:penicillin-binding protein 2
MKERSRGRHIFQPKAKKNDLHEEFSLAVRTQTLFVVALILLGLLVFRLWYLQILNGDQYTASASSNNERTISVEAPRGVVYDRTGQILVSNRGGLNVDLMAMDMPNPKTNPTAFNQEVSALSKELGLPVAEIQRVYNQAKALPYEATILKKDVAEIPVVTYLKEHSDEFPGVEIQTTSVRSYPNKSLASQILGYVGSLSSTDISQNSLLALTDQVGKDGIEKTYDRFLRGTDGHETVQVNSAGKPTQQLASVDPTPGDSLTLTIDSKLQQTAETALANAVQQAHLQGYKDADGGAVVALNPNNGQVLAMASYPTYDPSIWVGGVSTSTYDALNSKSANDPFLNRAIAGLYPVGSTFKPFVAATAMNAGLTTPDTTFLCPGRFSVAGTVWKDWNPASLGYVSLTQALEQSVDVYFYNLGYKLYNETGSVLQDGVKQFSFGADTGIDIPGESAGRVPDKTWKAKFGKTPQDQQWRPGDDINLAIGQGDLLATPLQVAVAYSAIANGGDIWIPHLGLKLTNPQGQVIHTFSDQKSSHVNMSSTDLAAIRQGLQLVVSGSSGTAYQVFKGFPIAVAGKTGTAQAPPGSAEAWFAAYAPADNPQIVVVAVVEHGGHGSSVAGPLVRSILEEYFHTKQTSQSGAKITE